MSLTEIISSNKKVLFATILQITLVLILAATALRPFLGSDAFYFSQAALSAVFLKTLFFDLQKETGKEHKYAVYFFAPLFLLFQLHWALQQLLLPMAGITFFLGFLAAVLLFIFSYKTLFGKNHTTAEVIASSEKIAVVQTDFDIRSFCTAARHIIETDRQIPKGKKVRITIKTGFFGQKTAKIL